MRTSHRPHAVLATAIVSTVVAAALVLSGPAAVAKPASITTSYGCAPFDQYPVTGTISVNLPAQVRAGRQVPDRQVQVRVKVPAEIVAAMRQYLGVTALSGKATKAAYRVGAKKVPLTGLVLPETRLPARGSVTLVATGTAKSFTLSNPGTYAVKVPLSFRLRAANQDGEPIPGTPLSCALASGAPSKLSSIKVVG